MEIARFGPWVAEIEVTPAVATDAERGVCSVVASGLVILLAARGLLTER